MKILVLEDDKNRIEQFKKKLKDHEVVYFTDVAPAIKYIEDYGITDVLFLDHDLDNKVFVPSNNENTGYQLAKFLVNGGYHCNQIIIHSMNGVGAVNMYNILKENNVANDIQKIMFPILIENLP